MEDLGKDREFRISTRESEMCDSRSLVRLYMYFVVVCLFLMFVLKWLPLLGELDQ